VVDEFLRVVTEVASEYYHVYGELGRDSDADIWYLARDRSNAKLVALRLHRIGTGPDGKPDLDLEVARQLDGSVAVGVGECHVCGAQLRRWARFCTKCGADLAQGQNVSSAGARAALLAEVKAAAAELYDVLGEMPWAGGAGAVFFAIEKLSGRLVRLRLRQQDSGFELGETRVMMRLSERIDATYVTRDDMPAIPSRSVQKPDFKSDDVAAGRAEAEASGGTSPPHRPEVVVGPPRERAPAPGMIRIRGRDVEAVTLVKVLGGVVLLLVVLMIGMLLFG